MIIVTLTGTSVRMPDQKEARDAAEYRVQQIDQRAAPRPHAEGIDEPYDSADREHPA